AFGGCAKPLRATSPDTALSTSRLEGFLARMGRSRVFAIAQLAAGRIRLTVESGRGLGSHPEGQLVAVGIEDVEVPHAVVVVLRRLDHVGAACGELGVHGIDVLHENAHAAVAGQPLGLLRGNQMQLDFVAAQARIVCRLAVLKRNSKAKHVAVMRDALGNVGYGENGGGTYHHGRCPHSTLIGGSRFRDGPCIWIMMSGSTAMVAVSRKNDSDLP